MSIPVSEDRTAFDWEARFQADDAPWERGMVHPALSDWIESGHLAPKTRVLVPGCGRSAEPLALAKAGCIVTASDIAPSAVRHQIQAFEAAKLSGTLLETDGLTYRSEEGFDALYEQTFLCAIHPHHRAAYERMAHAVLKPGSLFLALFMQKEARGGPPYGCDLLAMRTLFTSERWHWPEVDLKPYPHPRLNDKAELAAVLIRR